MAATFTAYAQTPEKFIGTWEQKAPDAPGYETGEVVIEKQSLITTFAGSSYKYPADWHKYHSDTLKYTMNVDGENVECYLLVKDKANLVGYASWSTGETDLILTRIKKQKAE
jgi:hypothetical protein